MREGVGALGQTCGVHGCLSEVSADEGVDSIAEMAGGWGNHIMQDEPSFIVLDGW